MASEKQIPWAIVWRCVCDLSLAIFVELRLVTDRQTDRQTYIQTDRQTETR